MHERHCYRAWPSSTDDMGWKVVAQKYPGITLARFEWRLFLQQLWESSIKEGIRISGAATEHADWHYEMDVETWQKILFACQLDTVEGLSKYVQAPQPQSATATEHGPHRMIFIVVLHSLAISTKRHCCRAWPRSWMLEECSISVRRLVGRHVKSSCVKMCAENNVENTPSRVHATLFWLPMYPKPLT